MMTNDVPSGNDPPITGLGLLFLEHSGPDARQLLQGLAETYRAGGASADLWRSSDQQEVWLLIVRGNEPELPLPSGTRRWRFEAAS